MEIAAFEPFFFWCTVLNGGVLILWVLAFMIMPDMVYRTQSAWFKISREQFDLLFYGFLGLFKIFFLFFNLIPYIAILILS